MLPPVIDIELYGGKKQDPPLRETVQKEIKEYIAIIEQAYGVKPILYATRKAYRLYLQDAFPGYDIWIRDILKTPCLEDGRPWVFWQYTDRMRLDGTNGEEAFIDMNVFYGKEDDFRRYGLSS